MKVKLALLTASVVLALGTQAQTPIAEPPSPWPLLSVPPIVGSPLPDLSAWNVAARDEMTTELRYTRSITNTFTQQAAEDPHGIILVGNGLNFKDPETGAYLPAQDLITQMPDGSAVALQGVTKLRCGATLADGILLTTRSGRTLLTRPSEILYVDKTTTGEVPLAKFNGSAKAEMAGLNRVLYRKALVSDLIEADLLITYTKSATESDIIIVKQPLLSPGDCGLSKEALLQVRSEWFNAPLPLISTRVVQRGIDGELVDQQIDMDGELWFPTGKVLSMESTVATDSSVAAQIDITGYAEGEGDVPVMKEWQAGEPSTLSESVQWKAIVDRIAKLPQMSRVRQQKETEEANLGVQSRRGELAALGKKPAGVAIDWIGVVSSSSSFTFNSYTNLNTYLLTNSVAFTSPATVTFQSNCIVKIAPGASLQLTGGLVCNGTTNLPSIITSRDDAAFGERSGMPDYTGCPSQLASKALWLNSQGNQYTVSGMRIRYATTGIRFDSERGCQAASQTVNSCVLESCQTGLYVGYCGVFIGYGNAANYVREVTTPVTYTSCSVSGSFITQTSLHSHIIAGMKWLTNGHSISTGKKLFAFDSSGHPTGYNVNGWLYGVKGFSALSPSNTPGVEYPEYFGQGAGTLVSPVHAITVGEFHWNNFSGRAFRFIDTNGNHQLVNCISHYSVTNSNGFDTDIGVLLFDRAVTNIHYARVLPASAMSKLPMLRRVFYDFPGEAETCAMNALPCIGSDWTQSTFALDWIGVQDNGYTYMAYSDRSIWLGDWAGPVHLMGGDSGHPFLVLINNELVLAGPNNSYRNSANRIHWCGPLLGNINATINALGPWTNGAPLYQVTECDLSGFPDS